MKARREVTIYIGGVYASREAAVVRTLVGSCIAACLRDPVTGIGGMNHFLLPAPCGGEAGGELSRFGIHAMELLIGEIQKLGGERARIEAKVFGGGHVLAVGESAETVPQQNVRFIREFLAAEGIPLAAQDLGGRSARQVLFRTDSGRVLLKRLPSTLVMMAAAEQEHQEQARRALQQYGEVTLFTE